MGKEVEEEEVEVEEEKEEVVEVDGPGIAHVSPGIAIFVRGVPDKVLLKFCWKINSAFPPMQ